MLQANSKVTVRHDETGFEFPQMVTREGGGREGDNQLIRLGGMTAPVAFEGPSEYAEVTCACVVLHEIGSGLTQKADDWQGDRFTVTELHTDGRGRTGFHRGDGWSGLLNGSALSDFAADGTDAKTLTLAITIDRRA